MISWFVRMDAMLCPFVGGVPTSVTLEERSGRSKAERRCKGKMLSILSIIAKIERGSHGRVDAECAADGRPDHRPCRELARRARDCVARCRGARRAFDLCRRPCRCETCVE